MKLIHKKSIERYGWTPIDFGVAENASDEVLEAAISDFQKEYSIRATGVVDSSTHRRLVLQKTKDLEYLDPDKKYSDYIIYNGKALSIDWDKVVLWYDEGGLEAKVEDYNYSIGNREIKKFIVHWDVCFNSRACHNALDGRGLSVTFMIDNDGTIYQTMDMCHVARHARSFNLDSLGVEISNAFYLKHQDWYVNHGFGERPIVKDAIVRDRKVQDHLGFYPAQIEALKALIKALHKGLGLKLKAPEWNGQEYTGTLSRRIVRKKEGILHHYHLSTNKIDSAGLNLVELVKEIKGEL